ncbi:hypothetical protein B0H10DRAFT_1775524 [Mycena sp. CBHHK59/15]|nr:hypothetical protein B0H10DRAFT_1775524 [Mycena sp. CBHHK59/15]
MITRTLQWENPVLYGRLNKGTVHKWISKTHKHWSKRTMKNVARRHALAWTGRVGFLSPYPDLIRAIKAKLIGLRSVGICVGQLLACTIILAMIQEKYLQLLETFKCSETYVSGFLESVMN